MGALVWTQKQAAQREGFARWLTRNQARLFFPMLLLEGIALKISGFQYLKRQPVRERALSALLLVAHLGLYVTLLLTVMSPGKAIAFAWCTTPSSASTSAWPSPPTTRAWRCPTPTGGPLGPPAPPGPHLAQRTRSCPHRLVPRRPQLPDRAPPLPEHAPGPHLRLAQPLVKAHCEELGLSYAETGLVESYRQALAHMHEVGAPLR